MLCTNLNKIYSRKQQLHCSEPEPQTWLTRPASGLRLGQQFPLQVKKQTHGPKKHLDRSGQKRDKSGISRLAMCQSTKRACIDLNSRRMVGKSHHLLSSLLENAIQKLIRHLGRKEYVLQFMHTKFTNGNYLILLGFINSTTQFYARNFCKLLKWYYPKK